MSMELLQTNGSYGLEVRWKVPRLSFINSNANGYHVTIGDNRGVKSWALKHETATDDAANLSYTTPEAETQSYFEYLWRFIKRHNTPDKLPFLIACPEDGLTYSAIFADNEFSKTDVTWKMWSVGLNIVQFRAVDGLEMGENPISQNNDSI